MQDKRKENSFCRACCHLLQDLAHLLYFLASECLWRSIFGSPSIFDLWFRSGHDSTVRSSWSSSRPHPFWWVGKHYNRDCNLMRIPMPALPSHITTNRLTEFGSGNFKTYLSKSNHYLPNQVDTNTNIPTMYHDKSRSHRSCWGYNHLHKININIKTKILTNIFINRKWNKMIQFNYNVLALPLPVWRSWLQKMVWIFSRQVCWLCPWARHLTEFLHLWMAR